MKEDISFTISVAFILILLALVNPKFASTPLQVIESSKGDSTLAQFPHENEGFYVSAEVYAKSYIGSTQVERSKMSSPIIVRQTSVDTDLSDQNIQNYTECCNDDLLVLGINFGNVLLRFSFTTSRTSKLSLLKTRHLLM